MSDQPWPPTAAPELASVGPGTLIASYQVEGIAGRGGMGIVYRATQQRPHRMVALKVISPQLAADPQFRQRFEREADVAASIEHPNVIPIYEAGDYNGLLFLAMRYIEGTDLREWLVEHGPMPAIRAARIIAQVGDALDAAHSSGLVHRDVKPGNVLLSERGGRDHVYLTDFGLTKQSASTAAFTKTGTWVGTVDYVAPEQVRGERVDARADIYSLGCVLFQLLTNQVPFERESDVSKIFAHMSDPPPSLGQFSPVLGRFDDVIKRAMAKDAKDRFASASDLGRAAVAVAEMRAIEIGEHSVAVGAAAPAGPGPPTDPNATQLDESQPSPTAWAAPSGGPGGVGPSGPGGMPPSGPGGMPPSGPGGAAVTGPSGPTMGQQAAGSPPGATLPPTAAQRMGPGTGVPGAGGPSQPVSPPGGYAQQPPGQPPAAAGGRQRGPNPKLIAAVVGGLILIAAIVVVVIVAGGSSTNSSSTTSTNAASHDQQLVQSAVQGYFGSSGPSACNFLSPANIQSNYGSLAKCQQQFQSSEAETIGPQTVSISGTDATDSVSVNTSNGGSDPLKLSLVKQNGNWLIDHIDNQNVDAIESTINSYATATGGDVCNFFSTQYINSNYNGSLAQCQKGNANATSLSVVGDQNVNENGKTGTDSFQLSNKKKFKASLSKQPNGQWLIDNLQVTG